MIFLFGRFETQVNAALLKLGNACDKNVNVCIDKEIQMIPAFIVIGGTE
jgi:hypothetical protein